MSDIVLQHLDQGLLTITMNRADRRNALNAEMTEGLVEAARRAAEDSGVRAVLIKGAGGTFCVGGDVKAMAVATPRPLEERVTTLRKGMEVSRILHQMQKPVVASWSRARRRHRPTRRRTTPPPNAWVGRRSPSGPARC